MFENRANSKRSDVHKDKIEGIINYFSGDVENWVMLSASMSRYRSEFGNREMDDDVMPLRCSCSWGGSSTIRSEPLHSDGQKAGPLWYRVLPSGHSFCVAGSNPELTICSGRGC